MRGHAELSRAIHPLATRTNRFPGPESSFMSAVQLPASRPLWSLLSFRGTAPRVGLPGRSPVPPRSGIASGVARG